MFVLPDSENYIDKPVLKQQITPSSSLTPYLENMY